MPNYYDTDAIKSALLQEENVNVTESNPIKDLFQILFNILIYIIVAYFLIYSISGILLSNLSIEKQIALENFLSRTITVESEKISDAEQDRLNKIRNNILKYDSSFPKTSNLNIGIIKNKHLNAFCYPNGNIYITLPLYKKLKKDDELTFIIAHEMAHYKHKDHLLNLRRGISASIVLIALSLGGGENGKFVAILERTLDLSDLHFSRGEEEGADKYAAAIMTEMYGNTDAAVEVMNILKEESDLRIEILSSHPKTERRIRYLKNYKLN